MDKGFFLPLWDATVILPCSTCKDNLSSWKSGSKVCISTNLLAQIFCFILSGTVAPKGIPADRCRGATLLNEVVSPTERETHLQIADLTLTKRRTGLFHAYSKMNS